MRTVLFCLRFLLICVGIGLLHSGVYAQKQANIWYFGLNSGLDFNSGSPVPLKNGVTEDNQDHSEGTSVISDNDGNLLFYSNGDKIWNKQHQPMPNGKNLSGSYSSSQAALIVPKPGSNRYFYVFTTDAFINTLKGGFRYSVVDMCLDNGLGDVIGGERDVLLEDMVTEKLAAVRHANGTDYWIVVHKCFSDAFIAYRLTSAGIVQPPVVSHVGSVHKSNCKETGGTVYTMAMGCMTFSPNGKMIALVTGNSCTNNISELFDFDKNTGQVSNAIDLRTDSVAVGYFGVAFSPDNSKLYISTFINHDYIYQYSITNGDATAIVNSKTVVSKGLVTTNCFTIQAGTDGKLYIAEFNSLYLSVIHNPNLAGAACNYEREGLYLGRLCSMGLPNFIAGFDYSNTKTPSISLDLGKDTSLCFGGTLIIDPRVVSSLTPVSYLWHDLSTNPIFTAASSGKYYVTVSNEGCTVTDTINVIIAPPIQLELGNDTTICRDTSIVLTAANPPATYLWSTGSTSDHITVKKPGKYFVKVFKNSCYYYDTVQIDTSSVIPLNLGPDRAACFHEPVVLSPTTPMDTYLWQDGSGADSFTAVLPGTYWVKCTQRVCKAYDTVILSQQIIPIANLGKDTSLCRENNPMLLDAQNPGSHYLWNNMSGSKTINGSAPGRYSVIVTNQYGCRDTDEIVLDTLSSPFVNIGNDQLLCDGGSATLDAGAGYASYLWSTGSTLQTTLAIAPSTITITIKDANGCSAQDQVVLAARPQPHIPIDDIIPACEPDLHLDAGSFVSYQWSNNSTSRTFHVTDYGTYSITVTDSNMCTNSLTIIVENDCPPALFVPNAFTPNEDKLNDTFKAGTFNIISLHMKIYNRWGELLFETSEMGKGWDGKTGIDYATADVYVYSITYTGKHGNAQHKSGNFTLLR